MCICGGGGVSGLMSSSSVTVGLCDLLTSRLPNRTIPGIWVILTWWGFRVLFFFRERLLLEQEGTAEPEREEKHQEGQISKDLWSKIELKKKVKSLPLQVSEYECLFWLLAAEDKAVSSPLIPFCSTRSLLFFFGWFSPKSSSSHSSARYSSSGTRADLLLVETAGVLENWGCDRPWRRVLALPKPRMALWYSSRTKTDGAGASLTLSLPELGIGLASLIAGTSFWLWAAGKLCRGRTERRGLTGLSESLSSEELPLFYGIHYTYKWHTAIVDVKN